MKKKKKRRRSKGEKVSLPNDVAPITHCDDDNCYTIGAIRTINDESDYAYDMKRPKLGKAMFDVLGNVRSPEQNQSKQVSSERTP